MNVLRADAGDGARVVHNSVYLSGLLSLDN